MNWIMHHWKQIAEGYALFTIAVIVIITWRVDDTHQEPV